jgi:hypothetical protein
MLMIPSEIKVFVPFFGVLTHTQNGIAGAIWEGNFCLFIGVYFILLSLGFGNGHPALGYGYFWEGPPGG